MKQLPQIIVCGIYDSRLGPQSGKKSEIRLVNHFEIELFKADSGISVINDIKHPIKSGSLLFVKPGDVRYSYFPFETYYVHFSVSDPELAAELMTLPTFLTDLENEGLKERFMKIIQLFYSASILDKFAAHAELISLLSAVSKLKDASGTASILGKAKRFIEGHFSENITVKSIAGHCNISETHLFRIFKNSLSVSPNDYLSEVRIAAAKKLLCVTEMSVNEIAYSCGFNSLSYFSDCFRRKCNTSPSAFRKQYKYPS